MPESDIGPLILAVLIQAPFAFRLGAVVRDGREHVAGGMFLALGAALAVVAVILTGSLLLAVCVALAPVLLLAHARFLAAHRAPAAAGNPEAGDEAMVAGAAAPGQAPEPPPPDALHLGMAFIGDMFETADRLGELRHRRRLRKLQWQQAERQAAAPSKPAPAERRLAPRVRRDGPLRETKRLPPPE